MKSKKILLLGSSGWVAHYLIPDLLNDGFKVIGISNKQRPKYEIENYQLAIGDESYIQKIKSLDCDVILNMLHAEDYERSFEVHKQMVNYCLGHGKHYTYLSSSNALDGEVDRSHDESDTAIGGTHYGKHKAQCEHYLYENMPGALIIRFPATHGYAPNRVARTEEFLMKLNAGEKISCPRGIYQCRPYVGHLAKMIAKAVLEEESGIFHMSTTTQSEEFDFLQKLAEAFGYSKDRVMSGEDMPWNMAILPGKIYKKYGPKYQFTEADTLEMLVKCPYLAKYRAV